MCVERVEQGTQDTALWGSYQVKSSQVKSSLALLSILPHIQYIHTDN